ncbi:MAG: nucleotidyltransferase domain-containing protein [Elusimicrobia bacterium]|nr:nucleotidyltransferase domain-containing protein [Elusimicrobiota bacterium]
MRPIPIRQIRAVARRIGRQLRPKKVILFGSYAHGHPTADSDVDLFIVMPSRQRPAERAALVSRLLHPRPFPVDILVRTPQEIRQRLALGDSFIEEIVTRGKILYEV